jgi:hypothetical protein
VDRLEHQRFLPKKTTLIIEAAQVIQQTEAPFQEAVILVLIRIIRGRRIL